MQIRSFWILLPLNFIGSAGKVVLLPPFFFFLGTKILPGLCLTVKTTYIQYLKSYFPRTHVINISKMINISEMMISYNPPWIICSTLLKIWFLKKLYSTALLRQLVPSCLISLFFKILIYRDNQVDLIHLIHPNFITFKQDLKCDNYIWDYLDLL